MRRSSKLNAIVCAMIFAAAVSASAKEGETRKTTSGGQAVCGDLVIGLEAGLEKRADEICADEAEKRNQHQYPVELTERRATSAEKDSLRDQIAGFESEKRALAESNDGLGQKLAQVRPLPLRPTQDPFRNLFQEPPPLLRHPFQEPRPSGEQDLLQERKDKAAEERASAEKAAEGAAAEKGAAEEKRLPIFELVTGASALIIGGVGLWLLRRAYQKASAPVQELLRKALVNPEEVGGLVESNATAPQDVDVMVFAPPVVPPCEEVIVQVFFHTPDREDEALNRAKIAEPAGQELAWVPLTIQVRQNDNIKVSMECLDAMTPEPVQRTVWNGRLVILQFMMRMPNVELIIRPKLRVFVNGVPAGNLVFKISVQQNPPDLRPSLANETARAYRKAFLSYASEDRIEVLKTAQTLRAFKIDFFQDLLNLSPGERWEQRLFTEIDNCDMFLLFWSHHAQQSKWVIFEAEHALQRAKIAPEDGVPEIVPYLLEGPPPPLPPVSLKDIHFNDPIRYIILAEESLRKGALPVESAA
jgi:TIR domain